jgi:hypothetical protein
MDSMQDVECLTKFDNAKNSLTLEPSTHIYCSEEEERYRMQSAFASVNEE